GQHEPPNLTAVSVEIDVRERTESEAFLGVNSPSERIEIPFDDPLLVTAGRFDQRVRSRNGDGIMADAPCRRPRNDPLVDDDAAHSTRLCVRDERGHFPDRFTGRSIDDRFPEALSPSHQCFSLNRERKSATAPPKPLRSSATYSRAESGTMTFSSETAMASGRGRKTAVVSPARHASVGSISKPTASASAPVEMITSTMSPRCVPSSVTTRLPNTSPPSSSLRSSANTPVFVIITASGPRP